MPLPVLKAHGLVARWYVPGTFVRAVLRASWRMDGHGAACAAWACTGTRNSSDKGSRVRTARLTLAGEVLLGFHGLLEGGPVLQWEGRDRYARRARGDGLVAARCLRPRGAVRVLAIELCLRHCERGAKRRWKSRAAAGARAAPAVHARVRALRPFRPEQRAQVLRHLAVPVGLERGRGVRGALLRLARRQHPQHL